MIREIISNKVEVVKYCDMRDEADMKMEQNSLLFYVFGVCQWQGG
jgi:hypothetical protein